MDPPRGSEPGFRRPIVVMQADAFNLSRIATTVGVALSSNLRLIDSPGNVLIPARTAGLSKDSVAIVSQLVTIDRRFLEERVGRLPPRFIAAIAGGLRLVLDLD